MNCNKELYQVGFCVNKGGHKADRLHEREDARPGDQTDSRILFNFFRVHIFEGIHPPGASWDWKRAYNDR
jgi:hypothetical protein